MKSNRKGAGFERRVCKRLSEWVSHGERDDLFWRTAMSGGRATLGLKSGNKRTAQAGDLASIADGDGSDFLKMFIVECKFRRDLELENFIIHRKGLLKRMWDKHLEECVQFSRRPFMVIRQNRTPTLLLVMWTGVCDLKLPDQKKTFVKKYNRAICAQLPHFVAGKLVGSICLLQFEKFLKMRYRGVKI